jgi:hypothetical protein
LYHYHSPPLSFYCYDLHASIPHCPSHTFSERPPMRTSTQGALFIPIPTCTTFLNDPVLMTLRYATMKITLRAGYGLRTLPLSLSLPFLLCFTPEIPYSSLYFRFSVLES